MSFSKILIANRGEIACRVIRTARALGYRTVAVFSDADADALHVRQADEAVRIGPPPAAASYLDSAAILDAARRTGAGALHPGYGFLSENAAFAQACIDAGLVFIGPPPAAIRAMGDKALAKQRMRAAGVPCVPGSEVQTQDDAQLTAEAQRIGVPLLVKAVAGGGGRGMRVVRRAEELADALAGARREARSAFGDDGVLLERLVEDARHIEIQVFADAHGGCIHLGERDCSTQRRRQKVIEESPSPLLTPALREAMGRDAVAAARAVGYVGAGTVEFIVDGDGRHHFLEMNTRLQVEHPVTECVTGLDLVEWQLRIASGEPLPLTQEQVRFEGHAIEARLYAEDPTAGFAPQTGPVLHWRPDTIAQRPGLRVDHGIAEGGRVSPYYDAMLAKFIAHGRDRDDAIRRLRAALVDAPLLGIANNGGFLVDLLGSDAFRSATITTATLDRWLDEGHALLQAPQPPDEAWCVAAAAIATAGGVGLRSDSVAAWELALRCKGSSETLRVRPSPGGAVVVTLRGHAHRLQLQRQDESTLHYVWQGVQRRCTVRIDDAVLHLALGGAVWVFGEPSPLPSAGVAVDARRALAPVAGVVAKVAVQPGDRVAAGTPLACVEAMKMELWVHAGADGTVLAVVAPAGTPVASGALLVTLEVETP